MDPLQWMGAVRIEIADKNITLKNPDQFLIIGKLWGI